MRGLRQVAVQGRLQQHPAMLQAAGSTTRSAGHDLSHGQTELRPARALDAAGPTQEPVDRHQLDVVEVRHRSLSNTFLWPHWHLGYQTSRHRGDRSNEDTM